jgi:hypothetical protein
LTNDPALLIAYKPTATIRRTVHRCPPGKELDVYEALRLTFNRPSSLGLLGLSPAAFNCVGDWEFSLQPLAGLSDNAEVDVTPSFDAALEESKLFLDIIGPLQASKVDAGSFM